MASAYGLKTSAGHILKSVQINLTPPSGVIGGLLGHLFWRQRKQRCAAISPISHSAAALYVWDMAGERDAQFATDLARMSDDEVRQHIEPSGQPVPILRTMAMTELERRRQKRLGVISRSSFSLGRVAVGTAVLGVIAAAIGVWVTWAGYVG